MNMMQDGVIEVSDIRPEVTAFAKAMERKLRDNDYKGGWKDMPIDAMWKRVIQELAELIGCHEDSDVLAKDLRFLDEAADVANYLMMMCDVRGHLQE